MSANPFAALDDDAPVAAVAKKTTEVKPKATAAPAAAPRPSNNTNGGSKAKPNSKAPKEFEGEVVGVEGEKSFNAKGGRGDHKGHSRSARRGRGEGADDGRQRSRRDFDRTHHAGKDGHRGGAGKANWGKPGDELAETDAAVDMDSETEPEVAEPSNELTFEQAQALKAEAKKALAAQWKPAAAKVIDTSAFEGLSLAQREEADVDVGNPTGPKAKRERSKNVAEKQKIDLGFRIAPSQPADDREDRGGRGSRDSGRGGRGGRDSGRGGRGGRDSGRGGRGARDSGRGGRGGGRGASIKIEDSSAFPTLGGK
jgi:plasminogen activator inhibitor 1 RNA-binding protein